MPLDRTPQNTLKPKLASNRTAKSPLTPRLAGAPSATPAGPAQPVRSAYGEVTPVKAFLNTNVTPRSSSRKSRVGFESPLSTPSGTPIHTPASDQAGYTVGGYSGHGDSSAQNGGRQRSLPAQGSSQVTPTPRLPLSNVYSPGTSDASSARPTSSLFFHASDARPAQEQLPPQKKAPVFFYADGKQDDTPKKYDASPPALSAFGKPQNKAPSPAHTASPLSMSPEPQEGPSGSPSSFRPPSPTKEWAHLSYRKGASQIMRPSLVTRTSGLSALSGPGTTDAPDRSSRRSSVASYALRGVHGKSASMSSIDSVADLKHISPNEPTVHSPSPLHTESRVVSSASLAESTASAPSLPEPAFSALPSPVPTSPTKQSGAQSALEAMNELAANARRERKVLDLEISNSSLLAINRGLEKEVRKQKSELRRFRRMSRAGRFSMGLGDSAHVASIREDSHTGDLSDMSEEEEEDPEALPDPDAESSDDSFDETQLSPSAQLERDEAHRLNDEKRLQLDLSKHRELLMDSQKMNQSLKRCLNWTEQLIKDGQKALEYQVRPSDVKLGGRVLVAEDHEAAQAQESKGLLSPWSPLHLPTDDLDALDSPFFAGAMERIVDRDSGVDVDGLEHLAAPDSAASLSSPFEERIHRLQASIEALGAS